MKTSIVFQYNILSFPCPVMSYDWAGMSSTMPSWFACQIYFLAPWGWSCFLSILRPAEMDPTSLSVLSCFTSHLSQLIHAHVSFILQFGCVCSWAINVQVNMDGHVVSKLIRFTIDVVVSLSINLTQYFYIRSTFVILILLHHLSNPCRRAGQAIQSFWLV